METMKASPRLRCDSHRTRILELAWEGTRANSWSGDSRSNTPLIKSSAISARQILSLRRADQNQESQPIFGCTHQNSQKTLNHKSRAGSTRRIFTGYCSQLCREPVGRQL